MLNFRSSSLTLTVIIFLLMLISFGCSTTDAPLAPGSVQDINPGDNGAASQQDTGGRVLWGIYNLTIDPVTLEVRVVPDRELEAHFNITSMLTNPTICPNMNCLVVQVTSQDPGQIFHVAVTLRNPTNMTAFDIRGIMVNNPGSHVLTNPDNYSSLWFGSPNPFKAFAKGAPKRQFPPASVYSEDYTVDFDLPMNFNVQYAIDASWPTNCKEPYWMKDINTEGTMTAQRGCSYLTLKAYDWNGVDDVESILVDTYMFNGGPTALDHETGTNNWSGLILNSFQVTTGQYDLLITAKSFDSNVKLYDYVTIDVQDFLADKAYQGDVENAINNAPVSDATITTSDGQQFFTTNSDMCGLYVLDPVPVGKRVISFSKPYFETRHYATLNEGTPNLVDGQMNPIPDAPPPLPVVTINDPVVDYEFGQASVTGTIENLDYPTAVMCVNHEEYLMEIDAETGEYTYVASLIPGVNYLRVRATNATGSVFSEEKMVQIGAADYPFRLVLTWDTITDQDFHGWDPNFAHASYIYKDIGTMFLDIDIISEGYGPETITATNWIPGRYYFGVNYYAEHEQSGATLESVNVLVNPGTMFEETQVFEHTLTYGNYNDGYPIYGDTESWWRVCDIVVDEFGIASIEPADTSIGLAD